MFFVPDKTNPKQTDKKTRKKKMSNAESKNSNVSFITHVNNVTHNNFYGDIKQSLYQA